MKIALIGYGKMGKAIEEIALQNGHQIVLKISIENTEDMTKKNLQKARRQPLSLLDRKVQQII